MNVLISKSLTLLHFITVDIVFSRECAIWLYCVSGIILNSIIIGIIIFGKPGAIDILSKIISVTAAAAPQKRHPAN